ncbi:hypothetical protein B0J11DRAFT_583648 [Dendryphion nanum]|uniref:RRM domain-containing protein n=1 Tax=Dendryphion nanum TaxID=256645 RepID=A0A9P9IEK4_9PLEO|nr:hypothetical protein B0J11DRAFT_583648 [Dendryphion nanum]
MPKPLVSSMSDFNVNDVTSVGDAKSDARALEHTDNALDPPDAAEMEKQTVVTNEPLEPLAWYGKAVFSTDLGRRSPREPPFPLPPTIARGLYVWEGFAQESWYWFRRYRHHYLCFFPGCGHTIHDLFDKDFIHRNDPSWVERLLEFIMNGNMVYSETYATDWVAKHPEHVDIMCSDIFGSGLYDPQHPLDVIDKLFVNGETEDFPRHFLYRTMNVIRKRHLGNKQYSLPEASSMSEKAKETTNAQVESTSTVVESANKDKQDILVPVISVDSRSRSRSRSKSSQARSLNSEVPPAIIQTMMPSAPTIYHTAGPNSIVDQSDMSGGLRGIPNDKHGSMAMNGQSFVPSSSSNGFSVPKNRQSRKGANYNNYSQSFNRPENVLGSMGMPPMRNFPGYLPAGPSPQFSHPTPMPGFYNGNIPNQLPGVPMVHPMMSSPYMVSSQTAYAPSYSYVGPGIDPGLMYPNPGNQTGKGQHMGELTNFARPPITGSQQYGVPMGHSHPRMSLHEQKPHGLYNPYGSERPDFVNVHTQHNKKPRGSMARKGSTGSYGQQYDHGQFSQRGREDDVDSHSGRRYDEINTSVTDDKEGGCTDTWIGPKNTTVNTLLVFELADTVVDADLANLFKKEAAIDIMSAFIKTDVSRKRYAHVQFRNTVDATKGLEISGCELKGRVIAIKVPRSYYTFRNLSGGSRISSDRGFQSGRRLSGFDASVHENLGGKGGAPYSPQDARSDLYHRKEDGAPIATGSPEKLKPMNPPKDSTGQGPVQNKKLSMDGANNVVKHVIFDPKTGVIETKFVPVEDETENVEVKNDPVQMAEKKTGEKVAVKDQTHMGTDTKSSGIKEASVIDAKEYKPASVKPPVEAAQAQTQNTCPSTSRAIKDEDSRATKMNETLPIVSSPALELDVKQPSSIASGVEQLGQVVDMSHVLVEENSTCPQHNATEGKDDHVVEANNSAVDSQIGNDSVSDDEQKNDVSFHSAQEAQSDNGKDEFKKTDPPASTIDTPKSPKAKLEPAAVSAHENLPATAHTVPSEGITTSMASIDKQQQSGSSSTPTATQTPMASSNKKAGPNQTESLSFFAMKKAQEKKEKEAKKKQKKKAKAEKVGPATKLPDTLAGFSKTAGPKVKVEAEGTPGDAYVQETETGEFLDPRCGSTKHFEAEEVKTEKVKAPAPNLKGSSVPAEPTDAFASSSDRGTLAFPDVTLTDTNVLGAEPEGLDHRPQGKKKSSLSVVVPRLAQNNPKLCITSGNLSGAASEVSISETLVDEDNGQIRSVNGKNPAVLPQLPTIHSEVPQGSLSSFLSLPPSVLSQPVLYTSPMNEEFHTPMQTPALPPAQNEPPKKKNNRKKKNKKAQSPTPDLAEIFTVDGVPVTEQVSHIALLEAYKAGKIQTPSVTRHQRQRELEKVQRECQLNTQNNSNNNPAKVTGGMGETGEQISSSSVGFPSSTSADAHHDVSTYLIFNTANGKMTRLQKAMEQSRLDLYDLTDQPCALTDNQWQNVKDVLKNARR